MMRGHILENPMKGIEFHGAVVRDGDVVLAIALGRVTHVRAALTGAFVTKRTEGLAKFGTGDVPRKFHRARTSSRTKCRRMILGRDGGSAKWLTADLRTCE